MRGRLLLTRQRDGDRCTLGRISAAYVSIQKLCQDLASCILLFDLFEVFATVEFETSERFEMEFNSDDFPSILSVSTTAGDTSLSETGKPIFHWIL